jgi:hypothetical protein
MQVMTKTYRIIKRKQHTGEPGNGGQFGHDAKPEGGVALDTSTSEYSAEAQSVLDDIKAAPFVNDLVYISYDDSLTKEQMTDYLAGRHAEVEDSLIEAFSDGRYDNEVSEAERFCRDNDVEFDELTDDEQFAIREAIVEKDTSDPVKDLLRVTHDQLLRAKVAQIGEIANAEVYADGDDVRFGQHDVTDGRVALISRVLTEQGMDVTSVEAQGAIRELAIEGPYDWHEGVTLEVIWYGGVEEASAIPRSDSLFPDAAGRKLKFAEPHVLLLDAWNGQGYEATIPSTLTVTVTPESPAQLDSEGGYGWDEIAGVNKGAYRTELTSEYFAEKELTAV